MLYIERIRRHNYELELLERAIICWFEFMNIALSFKNHKSKEVMNIHIFLQGSGPKEPLGRTMGNVSMPIPPRIGEAIFVPDYPNYCRVVDVIWQPDEKFNVGSNNEGKNCWANVVIKK